MADQPAPARIQIRIEASVFPGRSCGPSPDRPEGHHNIHVGVQRRDRPAELLGLQPGDATAAVWELEATATPGAGGADLRGPYICGRPGRRFIYLSWVSADDDGTFTMFRRAKLELDAVAPATLDAALRSGQLTGALELTDARGGPVCAAVRPGQITWSAPGA
jgi:Family of unknown function (DUF5990)